MSDFDAEGLLDGTNHTGNHSANFKVKTDKSEEKWTLYWKFLQFVGILISINLLLLAMSFYFVGVEKSMATNLLANVVGMLVVTTLGTKCPQLVPLLIITAPYVANFIVTAAVSLLEHLF